MQMESLRIVEPVRPVAPYIGGKRNLSRRLVERIEAIPHRTFRPLRKPRHLSSATCTISCGRNGELVLADTSGSEGPKLLANWGIIIAVVGLLEGVGIFLDEYHISHPTKERFRLLLVEVFFWLERTKIKTLPMMLFDKVAELKGLRRIYLTGILSVITFIGIMLNDPETWMRKPIFLMFLINKIKPSG
jgi:hypothetical protein